MNDATNSGENTTETNIVNPEHQNYYNWQDQQYIGRKYNGGLEQVTLELVPDIILEEEEDRFRQWADQYDQWDNTSYTPVDENDVGVPQHLMSPIMCSTSQKSNEMGHRRQEQSVNYLNQVTSRIFISANVNHKYGTFEANY